MELAGEGALRRYVAVYSAMITHVDEQIGRILDRIDSLGLVRDTIVLFTSDHGEFRGEHGMVEKDLLLYDCLLRVPCMIRWTGEIERRRSDALAEQIDLYPTLAELAGVPLPKGIQGRSLAALLRGDAIAHRTEVHAEVCQPDARNPFPDYESFRSGWDRAPFNVPGDHLKMIRTREHKYVWSPEGDRELYDLIADPGERTNLAGREELRGLERELEHRLFEWVVRTEDVRDREDDDELERTHPWAG
jgi:arylsulfatase